jgi:hypothetical protein
MPQPVSLLTWMRNCYKEMSTTHQVLQDISHNVLHMPCHCLLPFFVFIFLLATFFHFPKTSWPLNILACLSPFYIILLKFQSDHHTRCQQQAVKQGEIETCQILHQTDFSHLLFCYPLTQTLFQCSNTSAHTVFLSWSKRNLSYL